MWIQLLTPPVIPAVSAGYLLYVTRAQSKSERLLELKDKAGLFKRLHMSCVF